MKEETKSIHDFDFSFICNYFKALERQGPGSEEMTLKALGFIPPLDEGAKIADIGCGTGGQTMTLGRQLPGKITGVDLFPDFIDIFNSNAAHAGFGDRVRGIVGDMGSLPFSDEEFDLIWSEGAIYNVGFRKGLELWKRFLKKDGYIAVTEASWFTVERPAEIEDFWVNAYPEIDTIAANVSHMQQAGYMPVAHFVLPESCWTENFYGPVPEVQKEYLAKYGDNPAAVDLVESQRHEQHLYDKYKQYYGYVFYIGRKL